jgi:hypothetical protein
VLSRETGHTRRYGDNPYIGYDANPQPFLFDGQIDPRLPSTEHVLAGLVSGQAIAYPFSILQQKRVINDVVADVPVVAFWQDGATSALDESEIDSSRDIGMAALFNRELDGQTLDFILSDSGEIVDEQTGSIWNVFGLCVEGELAGKQLWREIAGPHFWFAWAAFRPQTIVYTDATN